MIRTIALIILLIITLSCKNEKSSETTSPSTVTPQKTEVSDDTINNLLRVTHPAEGELITSPLEITGEARGYWFFEATASVELLDGNMDQISEKYITATGEWMTEDWVPFSGTITFENPSTENGFLILNRANPSGLEEHAMSDTLQVKFRR
jgi:hypothetical protein